MFEKVDVASASSRICEGRR